jgi:uncharacterized protein (DUF4415 family)
MNKRKIVSPTPEEDAIINDASAAAPVSFEGDEKWFANAEAAATEMHELSHRGKQKATTKVPVTVHLDADIVESYKASGDGWQWRLDDDLANLLRRKSAR